MKTNRFQVAQLAISRKGSDVGTWYFVAGRCEVSDRVFVFDGRKYTPEKPKTKNPLHLQPVKRVVQEISKKLSGKTALDGERIRHLLLKEQKIRYQNKEVD